MSTLKSSGGLGSGSFLVRSLNHPIVLLQILLDGLQESTAPVYWGTVPAEVMPYSTNDCLGCTVPNEETRQELHAAQTLDVPSVGTSVDLFNEAIQLVGSASWAHPVVSEASNWNGLAP